MVILTFVLHERAFLCTLLYNQGYIVYVYSVHVDDFYTYVTFFVFLQSLTLQYHKCIVNWDTRRCTSKCRFPFLVNAQYSMVDM